MELFGLYAVRPHLSIKINIDFGHNSFLSSPLARKEDKNIPSLEHYAFFTVFWVNVDL